MAKDLAIVLNNGGINAAVATALAAQRHRTVLLYAETAAQPAAAARAAYDQQVAHFKPYREHTLEMPFLAALAGPDAAAAPAGPRQSAVVAARLIELLPLVAAATRYAVHYGASSVYLGLRLGTAPRPGGGPNAGDDLAQATEYVQVWNELLQLPCGRPDLEVMTPILELEPWQVIDVGFQAGVPFEKTWSCLEDVGEGAAPCWACPGCRARETAFQQAGKADPLRGSRRQ
jgi:7-cyano-7-deazaguanine synthase in queuosine biosynthesis